MPRPTLLMVEPEPEQALSTRKLVLESGKFNVITAHSEAEALDLARKFPAADGLIVHGGLKGECAKLVAQLKQQNPNTPAIVLAPSASFHCEHADHRVSSHNPEELLGLLRQLFGDPRLVDGH